MGLQIEKEVQELTVILKLKGILDISTTGTVTAILEDLQGIELLIFDFTNLDFLDSTGIGAILNAIHLSQERGFTIRLHGVNGLINHILETVGLYQLLGAIQGEVM
ncbi:STAS domain-containing protein [Peribacillus acanthi]|uniref:STAS domain-containing protein n=1 Tax=Peribacillus acanthi TaxID=2171554 RepID=UPI000D3EA932|nr:STAS domain-containing protein [Peribacillus acanthi]